MSTDVMKVLSISEGLKLNRKTYRQSYNSEIGALFLKEAKNVFLTQTGEVVGRRGMVKKVDGNFHSLYNYDKHNDCGYVIQVEKDGSASLLIVEMAGKNVSLVGLRSGLSNKKMYYAKCPFGLLYSNGVQNGIIKDRLSYPWQISDYTGKNEKEYLDFPPVKHLTYFRGSAFGVINDAGKQVIIYSLYGHLGTYNASKHYLDYKRPITCMFAVDNGLIVSTDEKVYFVSFDNEVPISKVIKTVPIVEDAVCDLEVDVKFFNSEYESVMARVANCKDGGCLFGVGGYVQELIKGHTQINSSENAILVTDESLVTITKED